MIPMRVDSILPSSHPNITIVPTTLIKTDMMVRLAKKATDKGDPKTGGGG